MKEISRELAQKIASDFLKEKKSTEKIDVAIVEQQDDDWIVRGTCPIDMEGHPWAEKFEVVVDRKGKVKSTYLTLL
jgi:phenylpyruvate tautomerase PptA (4-oxalocrotonate tautomerase family)